MAVFAVKATKTETKWVIVDAPDARQAKAKAAAAARHPQGRQRDWTFEGIDIGEPVLEDDGTDLAAL